MAQRCANEAPNCNVGVLIERQLEILFETSKILCKSLHLRQTLGDVLDLLHDMGGYEYGFASLLDDQTGALHVRAVHKEIPGQATAVRYNPGEGILGHVMDTGEAVVLERVADDPRFVDKLNVFDPALPFVAAPILVGGNTLGVLAAQPPGSGQLLQEHARFFKMVANLISQTVQLSREVSLERKALESERDTLRRAVKDRHGFDNIIGKTKRMHAIFEQVRLVSKWNTTVLIRGESGTGKELIANAIHFNSPRASEPFIKLNCAAIPENLLESELFGHEKGAFTGATSARKGRFELADHGTVFLDEIGEISGAFQAKLLRVLQEGEFERVGGSKTLKVDVRIIAATNRDLESEVEAGDFRQDLYYRLNVMPIMMPPLRERAEDIPDLSRFLVAKVAKDQGRGLKITDSAIRQLLRHNWPGNVRELENFLERAAIMCEGEVIDRDVIELASLGDQSFGKSLSSPSLSSVSEVVPSGIDYNDPNIDERERVVAALEEAGWVQAKAARLLNMTPRQIAYRIQTLNIRVRQI